MKILTRIPARIMALVMFVTALAAGAVPAHREQTVITQPDGTQVTLSLVGDEFYHFYLTVDDKMVIPNGQGYYFAKADANGRPEASDVLAADPTRRTQLQADFVRKMDDARLLKGATKARELSPLMRVPQVAGPQKAPAYASSAQPYVGKGLFPNNTFPTRGQVKALVVLVQYTDVQFTMADPKTYYTNMMNQVGFSQNNSTGSARDYFLACSTEQFQPQFDVYGPVTLPNDQAWYGGNVSGSDQRPHYMAIHALDALNSEVDFSQYDTDGDGTIDNVYVFYAGRGENYSGVSSDCVWPHAWYVYQGAGLSRYYDGKKLDHYACSNEVRSSSGSTLESIGTFCHEFSHVMGLPDLYVTDYNTEAVNLTPGEWDVMDQGSYNNNGRTPPSYSIWERNAFSWATLEELKSGTPRSVTLDAVNTSNKGFVIPTSSGNEFFLLENRQKTAWDAYLPNHGMLIWHIDYNSSVWTANKPNNTASHQYVDIEEACGTANNSNSSTMAKYVFPGTTPKYTSFTDDTTPNMRTWSGQRLSVPITNITERNGVISFDVCGGGVYVAPPTANASGTTACINDFQLVLTPASEGDEIHYEILTNDDLIDGVYTSPITISEYSLVDIWSEREGVSSSKVNLTFEFSVAPAVITPAGGSFTTLPQVSITSETRDAVIYYTLDGTTPTTSSTRYTAPFTPTGNCTVKALATKGSWTPGNVTSATFKTIEQQTGSCTLNLYQPWNNNLGGEWGSSYDNHTLEFAVATVDMTASKQSGTIPDYPVTKGSSVTVTMTPGCTPIRSAGITCQKWGSNNYTIKLQASTDGSNFSDVNGATSDNFVLDCNALPEGTIAVRFAFTGGNNKQIGLCEIRLSYGAAGQGGNEDPDPQDPDPEDPNNPDPEDPNPGEQGNSFTIEFKDNGSDNSSALSKSNYSSQVESGAEYASCTEISYVYAGNGGLKFGSGSKPGSITLAFNEGYVKPATKIVVNAKGYSASEGSLKIGGETKSISNNDFADYEWDLDGSDLASLTIETISTSKRCYVHAITIVWGGEIAPQKPETPVAVVATDKSGDTENFYDRATVSFNAYDGTIYYTLDGSDPTVVDNAARNTYGEAIELTATTTVRFVGKVGDLYSDEGSVTVTKVERQTVATPVFDPNGGQVPAGTTVTITCSTAGATIRYTTDGTDPTDASAIYNTPIVVDEAMTIKAMATKTEMTQSAVATAVFTIQPVVEKDYYEIIYKDAASDGSQDISSTTYPSMCEEGAGVASFVSASKVYDGTTGLKFSSKNVNGELVLSINSEYQVKVSKVVLNAKNSDSNATISLNNATAQSLTSDLADYEFTFDGNTVLTQLNINAVKRCYLKSIKIYPVKDTQDPDDPNEPDPEDPGEDDGTVKADNYTFDFTKEGYGMNLLSGNTNDYNPDPCTLEQEGVNAYITLTGSTRWWSAKSGTELRFYNGSAFEVEAEEGYRLVMVDVDGPGSWATNVDTYANGKWTGLAESVKFSYTNSSSGSYKGITIDVVQIPSFNLSRMYCDHADDGSVTLCCRLSHESHKHVSSYDIWVVRKQKAQSSGASYAAGDIETEVGRVTISGDDLKSDYIDVQVPLTGITPSSGVHQIVVRTQAKLVNNSDLLVNSTSYTDGEVAGSTGESEISVDSNLKGTQTGLGYVETETGECEYYNLQGIRVVNPVPGYYICRRDGRASVVLVR